MSMYTTESPPDVFRGDYASESDYEDDETLESPAEEAAEVNEMDDVDWVALAKDAYDSSTDFFDSSIRPGLDKNLSHFASRHAPGSKYYSEQYKYRAKGFRPKTRAMVTKAEAVIAKALFATQDVLSVMPENMADEAQQVSAEIAQALTNYRLQNSVPWFLVSVGAFQDCEVAGICISHQFWRYEERVVVDIDGNTITEIIKDQPDIELRPLENIRFSPAADWRDVMGTTPYIVDKIPMDMGSVMEKVRSGVFLDLTEAEIISAGRREQDEESTRSTRESKREDAHDIDYATGEFDTVWVHRNIIRHIGRDWLFYTLNTERLLSEPVPLEEEYPHLRPGVRPYVAGYTSFEAHKVYPTSPVGQVASLQQEANDINNQRRDNVALVLNRRYYARRNSVVDYSSLMNNVPGSITLMDNPDTDVRVEAPPEITGSAYQEQDRINLDFDELAGTFSTSSVSSNRQLNETVGGMEMLRGQSSDIEELRTRIFAETWLEPVLKQVVQLEQYFERDPAILKLVGDKIQLWQRYGVDEVTDRMLQGSMSVRVNIGFGATDPRQKIDKLVMSLDALGKFFPQMIATANGVEVAKDIFGAHGYRGIERYFPQMLQQQPDPEKEQMKQQIQEMQQILQSKQLETQAKTQVAEIQATSAIQKEQLRGQTELQAQQLKNEGLAMQEQVKAQLQRDLQQQELELKGLDRKLAAEVNEIKRGQLINQRNALVFQMRTKGEEILRQNRESKLSQTIMNDNYGNIPGAAG